jgi:hypothetical protein
VAEVLGAEGSVVKVENVLTFDPGDRANRKNMAWARFFDDRLERVGFVEDGWPATGLLVDQDESVNVELVVVEMPCWYPRKHKIDVNDLITIAVCVGWVEREYEDRLPVERVIPRAWKGTVPKEVMSQRIYETLRPEERSLIPLKRGRRASTNATDHDHNLLDAVGLGLWKLGRL